MPTVAVFGSSRTEPGTNAWQEADSLGHSLATAGLAVATGGYGGSMEAVSEGARRAGGHVIGVTADELFPYRPGPNRHVLEIRDHATIAARIGDLVENSDACIVLPGAIGTATELLVAWNQAYVYSLRRIPTRLLVAVGAPWDMLIPQIARALDAPADLVTMVPTAAAAATVVIENLA